MKSGKIIAETAMHRDEAVRTVFRLSRLHRIEFVAPEAGADAGRPQWRQKLAHRQKRLTQIMEALEMMPPEKMRSDPFNTGTRQKPVADWLPECERQVNAWRRARENVMEQLSAVHQYREDVKALTPLGVAPADLSGLGYLEIMAGWVAADWPGRLQLAARRTPLLFMPVAAGKKRTLIVAAVERAHRHILNWVLPAAYFEPLVSFTAADGRPPPERLDAGDTIRAGLEKKQADLLRHQKHLTARWGARLVGEWLLLQAQMKALDILERCGRLVDHMVLLTAALPADQKRTLQQQIQRSSRLPHAVFIHPALKRGA